MGNFISPVGRLVQGSMLLQVKNDPATGKPKLDDAGQQIQECWFSVAFAKTDPTYAPFWAQIYEEARAAFPHLVGADGTITHPKFSFKVQDGDGHDTNGKSVAGKPGFAGHWIVKFATRYAPRCFVFGKYDPSQVLTSPDDTIKRGHFIRVSGVINGNGVTPAQTSQVPGIFISPNMVEWVAFGAEIVSGPDAADVFGKAPGIVLPAGASATPLVAAGGAPPAPSAPMALPGTVPAPPAPAAPTPPAPAAPAAPAPPAPAAPAPPAPAGPQYQMTALAQGASREAMLAQGWTDDSMLAHNMMVKIG